MSGQHMLAALSHAFETGFDKLLHKLEKGEISKSEFARNVEILRVKLAAAHYNELENVTEMPVAVQLSYWDYPKYIPKADRREHAYLNFVKAVKDCLEKGFDVDGRPYCVSLFCHRALFVSPRCKEIVADPYLNVLGEDEGGRAVWSPISYLESLVDAEYLEMLESDKPLWVRAVADGLRTSPVSVLLVGDEYASSEHCYQDLVEAIVNERTVVPILFGNPFKFADSPFKRAVTERAVTPWQWLEFSSKTILEMCVATSSWRKMPPAFFANIKKAGKIIDDAIKSFAAAQEDIPVGPQPPRVDVCESCQRCAAAIHCRDCDSFFCRLCSSRRHKKGNMLMHRMADRGDGASMSCEMCSSAPDLVYCPTCDVGCCIACDRDLHRKLPMALHRRAPNVLSAHEVHFSAKMPLPVVLKGVAHGQGVNRGKALRALEVAGWNVAWSTRFQLFMAQLGGFKKLLGAAAENKAHSARAYRCVAELCKTSPQAARSMIEDFSALNQISRLLQERPERPALLTQACEALAQLIAHVPDACAPFLPSLVAPVLDVACPVAPGAADASERNPVEIPWLLKAGLRALGYVTMHSATASAVAGKLGAVPAVLAAMDEHAGAGELQAAAALAVQGLFVSVENRRQLLKARALRGLIRAVRQHPTDRAMLTVVFKALGSVAGQHVAVAAAAGRHRTVEQVIWAVRGNIEYPLLVAAGFDALTGLCNAARPTLTQGEGGDDELAGSDDGEGGAPPNGDAASRNNANRGEDDDDDDDDDGSGHGQGGEGNREEILEAGAVTLVLNVMTTLASSPEAQTASCKLLGAIMVNLPDVADALREGGAVTLALAAMRHFPAHAPLQAAACDALSALVAYGKGPDAALLAVKGGAVGLLLAALAAHPLDPRVAEDSCLLLAGLCAECPDEALSVGEQGGVALLVSALSAYMAVYEVLIQVATALRCVLAGYPENAARARRAHAQAAALQLLRRHVGDVRLVAAAADILSGVTVERDCARGVVEDGGLALLRGALDLHYRTSAGACAVVVEAVRQVCESSGTESKRIAGELGFVEALVEALEAHAGDPPTAASCMGALRVITLVPENADRFRRTRALAVVRSALAFVNPTPAAGSCDALVAEEAAGLLALGAAGAALGDTFVVQPVLPRPGAPMTVADKVAHVFKNATEAAQAEAEAEAQWQPSKQEEVVRPATLFLDVDTS